jgi:hypothetical protein
MADSRIDSGDNRRHQYQDVNQRERQEGAFEGASALEDTLE